MPRWLYALVLLGPLWLTLATCAAELPGPAACATSTDCAGRGLCVLGRCRPQGTPPVRLAARRVLFSPVDWVKLSSRLAPQLPRDSDVLPLGDLRSGRELLLLRFAVEVSPQDRIERALLVLDPLPGCSRLPAAIDLELSHVLSSWRSRALSWGRQPPLSLPMRLPSLSALPERPLRLDVTELLHEWREHPARHHGIALGAIGSGPGRACYSSGLTRGNGPRLEIYLAPSAVRKRPAAPDDAGSSDAGRTAADATPTGDAGEHSRHAERPP